MAKEKDEAPAPVRMIKVARQVGTSNGGPTEAEIPETSLPSWKKNGWKQMGGAGIFAAILLTALCIVAFGIVGRVLAESWNSTPHTFNVDVTLTEGLIRTPASLTAAATVSLTENKYDLDSTAGAFVVSLPDVAAGSVPADGQCWEFSLTVANGAVSFSPSAIGDLLDGSQAAYAGVDALGDSATICYDSGTTNYYFQSRYIH